MNTTAVSKGLVLFGSGDLHIYAVNAATSKLKWKYKTGAAVLGSSIINGDTVFIGGSDDSFLALNTTTGKMIWKFSGLDAAVVSTPLLYDGKIIFGAWDRNLYALNNKTGELIWKWNNGSTIRNYSPAACIPVADKGVVYVVAPDLYISAIDAVTGQLSNQKWCGLLY